MSMVPVFSHEDIDNRVRRAHDRRVSQIPPPHPQNEITDSEALNVINEIFNPSLKVPTTSSKDHYRAPRELSARDLFTQQDLDNAKLAELKELFTLLDMDCDGLISKDDLRAMFTALGSETHDEQLEQMLREAKTPLNCDAFVQLMCRRTAELDPEDVLLEAWSKWDEYGTGRIDERKMYIELTNYGDKLSNMEAREALDHAPLAKAKTLEEPPMIDYPAFCRMLSGLRKRN